MFKTKEESLAEAQEMFKGFEPKVIEGGKGKDVIPKKAGQGEFTKAQVLIARLENTLKTSKDPYVLENFPNFIKEIKAKPELANNKKVFDDFRRTFTKRSKVCGV